MGQKLEQEFTVLYVEDNPANLRLIMRLFSSKPEIKLISALTPSQGIKEALKNHPDLFMLDINLPEMDGYDLLEKLREFPQFNNTPAIAISANAMTVDVLKGQDSGFDDYVTKPIDITLFESLINQKINKKMQLRNNSLN